MARSVSLLLLGFAVGLFFGAFFLSGDAPAAPEDEVEPPPEILEIAAPPPPPPLPDYDAIDDARERALGDDDFERRVAIEDLIAMGPVAIERLAMTLRDPDGPHDFEIARCLEAMGRHAAPALRILIDRLALARPAERDDRSPDLPLPPRIREEEFRAHKLLEVVEAMGVAASEAEPLLRELAHHENDWVADPALDAWVAVTRDPRPVLPVLIERLGAEEERTRSRAARLLGKIGPLGRDALPQLLAALDDPSMDVRAWAAAALRELGPPPEAEPRLLRLFQEAAGQGFARLQAVQALEALPQMSDRARVSLAEALADAHPQIVLFATRALGAQEGPWSDELMQAVGTSVAAPRASTRRHAAWVLEKAPTLSPKARRDLEAQAAVETDDAVRKQIQKTLAAHDEAP